MLICRPNISRAILLKSWIRFLCCFSLKPAKTDFFPAIKIVLRMKIIHICLVYVLVVLFMAAPLKYVWKFNFRRYLFGGLLHYEVINLWKRNFLSFKYLLLRFLSSEWESFECMKNMQLDLLAMAVKLLILWIRPWELFQWRECLEDNFLLKFSFECEVEDS